MVTLNNWRFDRSTSAVYLNFNRNSALTEYSYVNGMSIRWSATTRSERHGDGADERDVSPA